MDSGGQASVSQNEILQSSPEPKNHVKTIISEDWKQTMYSRPSVIRKLSKSSGVDTNIISWPLSDSTGLQHESKGDWDRALSFPLNIQEEGLPVIPLSKKKLENGSGHVLLYGKANASQTTPFGEQNSSKHKDEALRRKRTITHAIVGESDQGKDETSVFKQEGRNIYCPSHYRKRTIIQANMDDDDTVFKQALAYPARPYGKRSKRQPFPATPWPFQKDEQSIRRTSFKREECGACAPVRHLLWMHGKRTIPECPSMSVAFKQEERNWKISPPPLLMYRNPIIHQGGLGERHQRRDGSHALKQEIENTTGNAQWCSSRKKTMKETSIEETSVNQIEDGSSEDEDEGGMGRPPWLNRKRTAKRFHDIGETQENVIIKPPNDQRKSPDEYKETDTLDYDPRRSRKVDNDAPSYSKDFEPMRQHAVGCSNVSRGFTDITGTTCPICYKTMSRPYHLKSHMLIHSGEKPFKCTFCSKSFNQIGNRNAHQRIHTGEKPYACEYCGKRFVFVSSKHNHLKMHLLMRQERQSLPTKST